MPRSRAGAFVRILALGVLVGGVGLAQHFTVGPSIATASSAATTDGNTTPSSATLTITSTVGVAQSLTLKVLPPSEWSISGKSETKISLEPGATATATLTPKDSSQPGTLQVFSSLGQLSTVTLKSPKGQPYLLAYAPQALKVHKICPFNLQLRLSCTDGKLETGEDISVKPDGTNPVVLGTLKGPQGNAQLILDIPKGQTSEQSFAKQTSLPFRLQPVAPQNYLATGKYEGTLTTLAVGTATAPSVAITVEVRDHWWIALGLILLGLAAGQAVQFLRTVWLAKNDLKIRRSKLPDSLEVKVADKQILSVSDFADRKKELLTSISGAKVDGAFYNPVLNEEAQKKILLEIQALETAKAQCEKLTTLAKSLAEIQIQAPDAITKPEDKTLDEPRLKTFVQHLLDETNPRTVKVDGLSSEVAKYTAALQAANQYATYASQLKALEISFDSITVGGTPSELALQAQAIARIGEAESILWREGSNPAVWLNEMAAALNTLTRAIDGLRQATSGGTRGTTMRGYSVAPQAPSMVILQPSTRMVTEEAKTEQQIFSRNVVLAGLLTLSVLIAAYGGIRDFYYTPGTYFGFADYGYWRAFMWGFGTRVFAEAIAAVLKTLPFGVSLTNPIK